MQLSLARTVCWTLVHSLWEGLLVALLAGLIILATRRRSAALRYNLLAANLMLFLVISAITFVYETGQSGNLQAPGIARIAVEMTANGNNNEDPTLVRNENSSGAPNSPAGAIGDNAIPSTAKPGQLKTAPGIFAAENLVQGTSDYLNTHAIVVTMIWLACLSVQMLRLTLGLYQVRRLRRSSTIPQQPCWNERLTVLARRLGIKRTVTLLQSALVKAPSALGFLKPSILVPIGMLANLPPDQVETILLHELAHIRRGDYAANLLLHLTEAIFFFNPGIRWVARLIRQEREACCDDIVLAGVPDRNSYFEALVAFKQWVIDGSFADGRSFTLQLGGGKTDLLWRIRRMLDRENKKLQIMEKAILSFGLMAVVTISLISMKDRDGGQPTRQKAERHQAPETILGTVQKATKQTPAQTAAQQAVHKTSGQTSVAVQTNAAAQTQTGNPSIPPHAETRLHLATLNNAAQNLEKQIVMLATANKLEAMMVAADTIPNEKTAPSPETTRTFPSFTSHTDLDNGQGIHTASAVDDQGNRYELKEVNTQTTEFKVNGKLVAKEDYGKYADFFAADQERRRAHPRPLRPMAATRSMQEAQRSLQEMRRSMDEIRRSIPQPPAAPETPESGRGYPGTAQYDQAVRAYENAARRYEEARRRYELAQRIYEDRLRERRVLENGNQGEFNNPAEPVSPAEPSDGASLASPVSPVPPLTGMIRPMSPEPPPTLTNPIIWKNPNPCLKKLVDELIESKLIDRVDKFSLSLDANGMNINGVRQSEETFAKFKAKYIRRPNDHIIYSQHYRSDSSGAHCEINLEDTTQDETTESK